MRFGLRRPWRRALVPLLALTGLVAMTSPASAVPAGRPAPAPPPPGTLLAARPATAADPAVTALGAREWLVWYSSRSGLDNRLIVVSGAVFVPGGPAPRGGRPVVTFAHGTHGVADDCAPSRSTDLDGELPIVLPLLQQGFVIAATDYEGLGTPGPNPYLIPTSEGRGVIDAVRAARQLVPDTGRRWAAFGDSQGGQAAWAANELARSWGRGLDFLGSVSTAPAANIVPATDNLPFGLSQVDRTLLLPFVLYGLKLQHPRLNYADYLSGQALALMPQLDVTCATQAKFANLPIADFVPRSPRAVDQLRHWLRDNALPQRPASGPMFVAQGDADTIVPPAWTGRAVARACRIGDTVAYRIYPGAGHPALPAAEADSIRWLDDRFTDVPAPSTCERP